MYIHSKNIEASERYIPDDFFSIKAITPDIVRELFKDAQSIALLTDISYQDSKHIMARQVTQEVSLEQLLTHINESQMDFFRFAVRRQFNFFLILADHKHFEDILEVFIRNICVDDKEYFLKCYVPIKHFDNFQEKYQLVPLH